MRRLSILFAAIVGLGCAGDPAPGPRRAVQDPGDRAADAHRSEEPAPAADEPEVAVGPPLAPDAPFVLTEGDCTIQVGPVVSFEVFRGGYESAEWIARLPAEQQEMAESEDHFEAHGRCVLEVDVGGAPRRYLHVVSGFVVAGPDPSREECLAAREQIARHLLVMTERCEDPTGRGTLTMP